MLRARACKESRQRTGRSPRWRRMSTTPCVVMTAPRPTGTSADPPRGCGPAWERPCARPARYRLTLGVSCGFVHAVKKGDRRPERGLVELSEDATGPRRMHVDSTESVGVDNRRVAPLTCRASAGVAGALDRFDDAIVVVAVGIAKALHRRLNPAFNEFARSHEIMVEACTVELRQQRMTHGVRSDDVTLGVHAAQLVG